MELALEVGAGPSPAKLHQDSGDESPCVTPVGVAHDAAAHGADAHRVNLSGPDGAIFEAIRPLTTAAVSVTAIEGKTEGLRKCSTPITAEDVVVTIEGTCGDGKPKLSPHLTPTSWSPSNSSALRSTIAKLRSGVVESSKPPKPEDSQKPKKCELEKFSTCLGTRSRFRLTLLPAMPVRASVYPSMMMLLSILWVAVRRYLHVIHEVLLCVTLTGILVLAATVDTRVVYLVLPWFGAAIYVLVYPHKTELILVVGVGASTDGEEPRPVPHLPVPARATPTLRLLDVGLFDTQSNGAIGDKLLQLSRFFSPSALSDTHVAFPMGATTREVMAVVSTSAPSNIPSTFRAEDVQSLVAGTFLAYRVGRMSHALCGCGACCEQHVHTTWETLDSLFERREAPFQ
jgi:hypothetical protein